MLGKFFQEFLGVDLRSDWLRVDDPDELLHWVAEEIGPSVYEVMAAAADRNGEMAAAMRGGWKDGLPAAADPGPVPTALARSVFVSKYNPGEFYNRPGLFYSTDPYDYPWGSTAGALQECWLSTAFSSSAAVGSPPWRRFANLVDTVAAGDLIFVQRTASTQRANRSYPDAPVGTLIGVWWVEHPITWPSTSGEWLTDVVCLPLTHFTSPVRIPAVQARDMAFRDIKAFRRGSYGATCLAPVDDPAQALALVRACTLPYEVLSTDDLPAMAARLARRYTGLRPEYRDAIVNNVARAALNQTKEAIAVRLVADRLVAAGFGFADRRRVRNYGADLYAMRWPANGDAPIRRIIEVKATEGSNPFVVRPTPSQVQAARRSAKANDGEWWFVVVTNVLTNPTATFYAAHEFLQRWANAA